MEKEIKELRVKIDGLAQLTTGLRPIKPDKYTEEFVKQLETLFDKPLGYNSKEIEGAVDSLYLAKAWLGKILGVLGTKSPYGEGYKSKEDIVPTQDVSSKLEREYNVEWNHVSKVDWLRSEISNLIEEAPDFSNDFSEFTLDEIVLEQGFVYKYLCEARFWLGFELERIKNENSN